MMDVSYNNEDKVEMLSIMERHIYMAGSPFSNGFEVYENQMNLVNLPDESGVPNLSWIEILLYTVG